MTEPTVLLVQHPEETREIDVLLNTDSPSDENEEDTAELPVDLGEEFRECGARIIPEADIRWGDRFGGRALRTWHQAHLYGSLVAVARQNSPDNPPPAMLKASLTAYASLHHPNIVSLLGVSEKGHIITELCEQDLSPREDAGEYQEKKNMIERVTLARDLARALAWAHSLGVVHRDVKPSHFLKSHGNAKLGGWLFAEIIDPLQTMHPPPDDRFHGTPLYMAPELWGTERFDARKSDVYSFSLALWEIIHGRPVFASHHDILVFKKAVLENGERPEIGEEIPGALKKLLESGWSVKPEERPEMVEVVNALDRVLEAMKVLEGSEESCTSKK